jgi:hypothetical protein
MASFETNQEPPQNNEIVANAQYAFDCFDNTAQSNAKTFELEYVKNSARKQRFHDRMP